MSPTRPTVAVLAASALGSPSLTRVLVALAYLTAGGLNARALVFGARPAAAGVLASGCYLVAWLAYAAQAGRSRDCRGLRRMAMFWAVTIGGTAICGTLLRMHLGAGTAVAGGWVAPAVLLVVAAPLYGLAGWFGDDPLAVLVAVAMTSAVLTIAVALGARRWGSTTGPRPSPLRRPSVNPSGRTTLTSRGGAGLSRE